MGIAHIDLLPALGVSLTEFLGMWLDGSTSEYVEEMHLNTGSHMILFSIYNSTAAKGQKIQITSTRKRTSSDIYQNLADNVRNMNLDDAILAYLHKMCEGGQK